MPQEFSSLSVEEKIGQLFFIGIQGSQLAEANLSLLADISPGGVCLFTRNIKTAEQTRLLVNEIREVLHIEPFLSIDQEGGLVDRLRRVITPMPSAASIQSIEDVRTLAELTGDILRMLGFNMNFAPVIDVIDVERAVYSNGLYSRTFGKSKETVVEFAGTYLDSLQKRGCLGCVKHFPGLGASQADSHEDLPVVNLTREELLSKDLYPYRKLFKTSQVNAVMAAHGSYPLSDLQETDVNGKLLPSSISYNFITNLLRVELGYQGLVITDDLEMGAILKNYGVGDACIKALNAGVDMLCICAEEDAVRSGFAAVLDAVKTGIITEARIEESLRRIAKIKSFIEPPLPFDTSRLQILSQKISDLNKKLNYSFGG